VTPKAQETEAKLDNSKRKKNQQNEKNKMKNKMFSSQCI
jgi:hypothetical protein